MKPSRGDIWLVKLNPVIGREQAGQRPCLIISVDLFNHGPAGLVVVLPITTKNKGIPFHVEVAPPEGGLKEISYIKCEDVRSISTDRLIEKWGSIDYAKTQLIEDRLRILMGL
ncbi:type II toxin-antitoxin system PemK/MazF family toxin [Desulfitibacter alkalitolerans]|jgi:mRNA interferase MazF|uniref:type II toxin-antitoxin system PemK/MazF family toxin n=1 Tax=Desulfitibacter alkalitolerans TaxID=264641 RepID=UPI000484AF63|nr:type II toxin-antitoxin system PemK/MazF family toxin [Desulfitibacter alkalitolerans]